MRDEDEPAADASADATPEESAEIQLIADESGIAVLGPSAAVEAFLAQEGLVSRPLTARHLGSVLRGGSATAEAASEVSANAGRWVKLSEDSARAMKKHGLRESKSSGLSTGVLQGEKKGQIGGFVEFVRGPGKSMRNPAALAGAAGIMAQLAMQQAMDEVTDYLERIDAKLDQVLRAQRDSVLSRLIGAGFVIDEAMTVRHSRGKVDEVTWSKVQTVPSTIAEVQGYALGQLDALAQKLESATKASDLADATREVQAGTQEWLAVLARTFQLQDGIAVLELDRVLDAAPDEIDAHRTGLRVARQERVRLIETTTTRLLERIVDASGRANAKVLTHPSKSPAAVRAGAQVAGTVVEFHDLLELDVDVDPVEARAWRTAAGDARKRAIESGSHRLDGAKRGTGAAYDKAKLTARERVRAPRERVGQVVRAVRDRGRDGDEEA